jgi:hypothetical protein
MAQEIQGQSPQRHYNSNQLAVFFCRNKSSIILNTALRCIEQWSLGHISSLTKFTFRWHVFSNINHPSRIHVTLTTREELEKLESVLVAKLAANNQLISSNGL